MAERLYQTDPLKLEFTAQVIGKTALQDGRRGILLDHTYFCPTGGGQEHDTGMLGNAAVVDVLVDERDEIVHIVDRDIPESGVLGRIDRARRLAIMQHHSGQHLFSAALEDRLGLETVSARISIDSPSTIDLNALAVGEQDLVQVENLANAVVREDRPIKSYLVAEQDVPTIPFRRPPKVHGQIRVVEIDSFDHSACGGTHCTRTGMIGLVKILKAERQGNQLRIYFVAGERALEYFQNYAAIVNRVARKLDTGPESIHDNLDRTLASLKAAQQELEGLESERLTLEAWRLEQAAEKVDSIRLVRAIYRGRTPQQLRALVSALQDQPHVVAVLASFDGVKLTVAVACGLRTGLRANALLQRLMEEIRGRGGGDTRVAQGGGAADEKQAERLLENVANYIQKLK